MTNEYRKIYDALKQAGVPVRYGRISAPEEVPFLVFMGAGQNTMEADNTIYWKEGTWQIEYYFATKNPVTEELIEQALLDNGYIYEKSEDNFIEGEGVFVIYYDV